LLKGRLKKGTKVIRGGEPGEKCGKRPKNITEVNALFPSPLNESGRSKVLLHNVVWKRTQNEDRLGRGKKKESSKPKKGRGAWGKSIL